MKIRQITPDWLKGLAIVLMVYGHVTHVGSLAILQKQIVEIIYTFHMPLFLIISGFFFRITTQKDFSPLKRLARRLVLPYFIFISLYLIGLTLIKQIGIPTNNNPPDSLLDFVRIVLLDPRGAYWFIHSIILIQFCFIFARLVVLYSKLDEDVFIIIAIFLLAMACNFELITSRTVIYFLLGFTLSRFWNDVPASLGVGALLIVIIAVFFNTEVFTFSFVQIAWCLSMLLLLAGIGRAIEPSSIVSIFSWFGRNSLVVLVVHAMFIVLFKPLADLFVLLDQSGLIYSIIVVTSTMLGSMLIAALSDKIRISKYIFGVRNIYSDLSRPSA